uniref:(northern house mosquito) hypothetical protein n=1 Tax=Culex pipiens TaxID=7175 RepID=A0A8D8DJI7_CULPI
MIEVGIMHNCIIQVSIQQSSQNGVKVIFGKGFSIRFGVLAKLCDEDNPEAITLLNNNYFLNHFFHKTIIFSKTTFQVMGFSISNNIHDICHAKKLIIKQFKNHFLKSNYIFQLL